MQHLAGEISRIVGRERFPMMSVRNDEAVIIARFLLALDRDLPAFLRGLGPRHARIEADQGIKAELSGVSAQIVLRLRPARIERPLLGEGKVRVARQLLRRVEVGRAVNGMRTLGIPNAADIAERLEAIESDPPFGEGLGHGKPASSRADDAKTLHGPLTSYAVKPQGRLSGRLGPDLSILTLKL